MTSSTRVSFSLSCLFVALALAASACSSGDVAVGSSQEELKKSPSGKPTGNGQTCSWSDPLTPEQAATANTRAPYKVGDTFKSVDGCNDCSCSAQGIVCTLRACAPPPAGGGGTCAYGGKTYSAGQSFRSTDGCNGCGCQADGTVVCTELACAPAPAACKKTGCSGEICSDQDVASTCIWTASYACYQTATCERQTNGNCGFTQTAALTQCLASK